jgi:hypothetical protein
MSKATILLPLLLLGAVLSNPSFLKGASATMPTDLQDTYFPSTGAIAFFQELQAFNNVIIPEGCRLRDDSDLAVLTPAILNFKMSIVKFSQNVGNIDQVFNDWKLVKDTVEVLQGPCKPVYQRIYQDFDELIYFVIKPEYLSNLWDHLRNPTFLPNVVSKVMRVVGNLLLPYDEFQIGFSVGNLVQYILFNDFQH